MVGFISEPTIEEEDLNQAPKLKILKDPLDPSDPFDPKINDLSYADSFLDFDSIKDWFEDIPNPDMIDSEKVECRVAEKPVEMVGDQIAHGSDPIVDGVEPIEGWSGCTVKVEEGEGEKVGNLGSYIEEEMGKVSLVGGSGGDSVLVDGNGVKSEMVSGEDMCESGNGVKGDIVSDENESGPESESLSSSSSSSISDDDDDDDGEEEEEEEKDKEEKEEVKMEMKREVDMEAEVEEGEITDVDGKEMVDGDDDDDHDDNDDDVDEMVVWTDVDDEDDGGGDTVKGPIRSKNELKVLPSVPPVDVTLQPYHQTQPVGNVLSVLGAQVIVEGVERHSPLNEGSILWITKSRSPLGLIDEIFGPVKNPYYMVRYNTENEVPDGIHAGTSISFVPEFASHVLNEKNLYKKGYDASGENDEELSDGAEFSDDEKEAEYKRTLKMSKRGMNDQRPGNRTNNRKKGKNREGTWKNGKPSVQETSFCLGQLPPNQNKHHVSPIAGSLDPGNCSSSFGIGQGFAGGTGLVPAFPRTAQTTGFAPPSNGVWTTGLPCQQLTSAVFPNGFPTNGMQWPSQNNHQQPFQIPMPNGMPFQRQLDTSQRSHSNFFLPGGHSNYVPGPSYATWQGPVDQNGFNQATFGMGLQGQHGHIPINGGGQGIMSNGLNMEQNCNLRPPTGIPRNIEVPQQFNMEQNCNLRPPTSIPSNIEVPQQFNLGASSSRGRRQYHRGGGRFAGGRGRQQS